MNKTQKFSNEHQLDQDLCGITGGTYRTTKTLRSKASILKQIPENVRNALTGNKWEIIRYDPLVFIIAHTDLSQIVKGSVHEKENRVRDEKGQFTGETKTTYSLKLDDVLIAAYPLEIISHENPLGFTEHRYTIRFRSHTGRCFTIGPKTIEEIMTGLRESIGICFERSCRGSFYDYWCVCQGQPACSRRRHRNSRILLA